MKAQDMKAELLSRVLDIADLEPRKSRYSKEEAIFLNKREIGHFHSDFEIDIRLTRLQIKKLKSRESQDPRLVYDRDSSDWIAVKFEKAIDLDFIVNLFETAAKANR
jgi:hypothetical protein